MVPFVDTHTHIYTEEFDEDRDAVVDSAIAAGAEYLLLPNINAESIGPMLSLCDQYPGLCKPMLGLHPTELPNDPEQLLRQMERMLSLPDNPFVAVGEVGIDLYWDDSRRDEQITVFRQQIEWACRYEMPLVIHSRSAHRYIIDSLALYKSQLFGGVFHCFGGTADEAREMLEFDNFMIGIGGAVTYAFGKHFPPKDRGNLHPKILLVLDNQETLPGILRHNVPLQRLVVETDAPYLSPSPCRGLRNQPANIPHIIHALSLIYDTTYDEVAEITTQNAKRLFGLG